MNKNIPIPSYKQVQKDVNELIEEFFQQRINDVAGIGDSYKKLWQETANFALSGGKRIRPYLTVLAYIGAGGKDYNHALNTAMVQELLHLSLIILDDIIDRDTVRYGRDTVAEFFCKEYSLLTEEENEASHLGNASGLLASSLLLSSAHDVLAHLIINHPRQSEILKTFQIGIIEVAGGQLLDSESPLRNFEEVDSLNILRYKTASYSFITPLKIGTLLANAPDKLVDCLGLVGKNIGIAYQLVDDMLGIFGEESVIGKSNLTDLKEGKKTHLLQETLRVADEDDRKFIHNVLGSQKVTATDLEKVRSIITKNSIDKKVEKTIQKLERESKELLAESSLSSDAKQSLDQLMSSALTRNY